MKHVQAMAEYSLLKERIFEQNSYTYVELLHNLVAAVKPMQHLPYDFAFENKHESEH